MMVTTRSFLTSAFLLALSVSACTAASSPDGAAEGEDGTVGSAQSAAGTVGTVGDFGRIVPIGPIGPVVDYPPPPAAKPHSFLAPATWANRMVYNDGWTEKFPRQLADFDGDGRKDVVGFGDAGVWSARSFGSSFEVRYVLANFGQSAGSWTTARHERLIGDINGDGKDDIVGFGDAGVYTATSTGSGFTPASFVIGDFGYDSGWRVDQHVRVLADVDGDGKQDIVAYGNDGVWIARSAGSAFSPHAYVLARFGNNQGFNNTRHVRTAADVNGDGRADLVVFADDGVYTALSNGTGFATPNKVVNNLGYNDGWRTADHPRMLVDVNRDGRRDIVAFGDDGVWVARSNGAGFASPTLEVGQFGTAHGFGGGQKFRPRFVADFNGDGYADIVGSGPQNVWRSLGGPSGFSVAEYVLSDFSGLESMGGGSKPVLAGDVDGDGKVDLVGFGTTEIEVARSADVAPPAPPSAPSNLRQTTLGSSQIVIAWDDNSSNEIRFRVQYKKAGATYTTRLVDANTPTLSFNGLASSTQYCFKVTADGQFNTSSTTPELCVTTKASTGGGGGGGGGGETDPLSEIRCGTGLSVCRAGYHGEELVFSSTCPGNNPTYDNATKCVKDSDVFIACEIQTCPATHHPVSFIFRPGCDQSTNIPTTADNATTCQANTQTFPSCGGCPPGYSGTQTFSNAACTPYYTYSCTKL